MKRWVYGAAFALIAALPGFSMVRIAIFIGNNIGLSDEKPLHYATRDAEQVQAVLTELGGADKGGSRLLLDNDVGKVESILQDTRNRILSLRRQGQKVQLLLYFSGHGSDDALHMNGEKLPMSRIRSYFKDSEADLKILIADACFSGSLIEAKGAVLSEAVPIKYHDELNVNGSAILTSSSAGELSQESKELKGSLFTHYLLTAIRGAGDADHDGKVSLWEAYIYTQTNLRRRLATFNNAPQNPGFDLDVRGSENLVLTRMDMGQSQLSLKGVPQGRYHIMESVGAFQIAEVNVATEDAVVLALPKAPYLIYQSQGRKGLAGYADLRKAKSVELRAKDFSPMPVGELSAKGYLSRPFLPPQGSPIRAALHPRYYPAFPGRTGGALALAAGMQGIYGPMGTIVEFAYLPGRMERAGGEELSQTGIGLGGEFRYYRNLGRAGNAHLGPRLEFWQLEQTINGSRNNQARLLGSFAMAGLEKRVAYRLSMGLGIGAGCFWSYDQAGGLRRDAAFPITVSLRYDL